MIRRRRLYSDPFHLERARHLNDIFPHDPKRTKTQGILAQAISCSKSSLLSRGVSCSFGHFCIPGSAEVMCLARDGAPQQCQMDGCRCCVDRGQRRNGGRWCSVGVGARRNPNDQPRKVQERASRSRDEAISEARGHVGKLEVAISALGEDD